MFAGTVAENLRIMDQEASDEALWRVLDLACAGDFVRKLPQGLNTELKEGGGSLSSGQAQRLSIARALLADAPVLLLDEATSALDVPVQKQIMELLQKLKKENQLSFLFICHDLALVQLFCDRVIVMHDGHVEEEGTPEEIIEHPKTEYTEQLIRSVL
mgnify:FL=1